jgi:hypothetical protein
MEIVGVVFAGANCEAAVVISASLADWPPTTDQSVTREMTSCASRRAQKWAFLICSAVLWEQLGDSSFGGVNRRGEQVRCTYTFDIAFHCDSQSIPLCVRISRIYT